jgi:hypothetical protein
MAAQASFLAAEPRNPLRKGMEGLCSFVFVFPPAAPLTGLSHKNGQPCLTGISEAQSMS